MGRQNQQPTAAETDAFKLEDESLATNLAATPIPLGIGESKTAVRWITPIYGQTTVQVARSATSKKG
jgi:hypothetical protein